MTSPGGLALVLNASCLVTNPSSINDEELNQDVISSNWLKDCLGIEEQALGTTVSPENILQFIDGKLQEFPKTEDISAGNPYQSMKCGPAIVQMLKTTEDMMFSRDYLEMESHGRFVTCTGNTCVFAGGWQYEVTLDTAGVQQIGWAAIGSVFSHDHGVGDGHLSFAFDGKRVKKWNETATNYGEVWMPGDVIGCCIDLDVRQISFFRNGIALGVAFYDIPQGTGVAYFPALTLSYGERCCLNFGHKPFKYPQYGFLPLQPAPDSDTMQKASYFCSCLSYMCHCTGTNDDIVMCLDALIRHMNEVVCSAFACSQTVIPVLLSLAEASTCTKLQRVMSLLLNVCNYEQCHAFVQNIMSSIASRCRTSLFLSHHDPVAPYLHLASLFAEIPVFIKMWCALESYYRDLECLLACKYASSLDLSRLLPVQPNTITLCEEGKKHLVHKSRHLDAAQYVLVSTLLASNGRPPFLRWLHQLILKNAGANRNIPPPGLSDSSVVINVFFVLLRLCDHLIADPKKAAMYLQKRDLRGDILSLDLPRLGGTVQHLLKYASLEQRDLAIDEDIDFYCTLLESTVLLYHFRIQTEIKKYLLELSSQHHNHQNLIQAQQQGVDHTLLQIYKTDLLDGERLDQWNLSRFVSNVNKDRLLFFCFSVCVEMMDVHSANAVALSFLPQFYVETALDILYCLPKLQPQFEHSREKTEQYYKLFCFISRQLCNSIIINPDTQRLLFQSVMLLLEDKSLLDKLENDDENTEWMIMGLLHGVTGVHWMLAAKIILRIYHGTAFGDTGEARTDLVILQKHFKNVVDGDDDAGEKCLHAILNHWNWAATELATALNTLSTRTIDQEDSHQAIILRYKTIACLLRVVEIMTLEAPKYFLSHHSLNCNRLAQLLLVIFHRFIDGRDADALRQALSRRYPDDEVCCFRSVIYPTAGILMNIMTHDQQLLLPKALKESQSVSLPQFSQFMMFLQNSFPSATWDLTPLHNLADALTHQDKNELTEEELCPICCTFPLDTVFYPCGHKSCRHCISRQLLESQRCFFCNVPVQSFKHIS